MSTDYVYWTFTAAAQCVSTFVALLLTGYALVLAQIEAARERDDSLQELHTVLRASYHARLTVLAWLTALAVLLSLLVVWVNRSDHTAPPWMMSFAALADIVAMVAGLAFVVTIIDPRRYQKAAERELEHQQVAAQPGTVTSAEVFFKAFRQLERALRDQIKRQGLGAEPGDDGKGPSSVRQMAAALLDNGSIGEDFHAELLQVAKYRNLLFHGHVKQADTGMVERTTRDAALVRQLA
ncbi:hypothetical protein [Ideonella sp.]|uniref:hypothetical protein n=1 Tax=Ideonella sp. TaxID=1929293 RepID=UPI002B478A93|nr:hypothetical protein [Ideonella sp.]HJV70320.1 hypothetical protein [Ideonella sp.]